MLEVNQKITQKAGELQVNQIYKFTLKLDVNLYNTSKLESYE